MASESESFSVADDPDGIAEVFANDTDFSMCRGATTRDRG